MRSATKYGGGRSSAWLRVQNSVPAQERWYYVIHEEIGEADQLSHRSQFLDVPAGFFSGEAAALYVTALTVGIWSEL
jgi:hypothetical protein